MQKFTIQIEVTARSSGAAYDWILRQTMGEINYCEIEDIAVFNEDGYDVTNEEEVYPGFDEE